MVWTGVASSRIRRRNGISSMSLVLERNLPCLHSLSRSRAGRRIQGEVLESGCRRNDIPRWFYLMSPLALLLAYRNNTTSSPTPLID